MAELQHIHGGNLREAAEKYGLTTNEIIDFSANINPLGPSPRAIQAIKDNLNQIIHYPDPDCRKLKKIISGRMEIPVENIITGNGAAELIFLLCNLLKPKKVVIPAPTFSEYQVAGMSSGSDIDFFKLPREKDFALEVDSLIKAMPGQDMVFICNPNNPTGKLLKKKEIIKIIEAGRETGTTVVVDEAFLDFLPDRGNYSVAGEINNYDNLFVLYSLTKFFAIPGLRLGAAFGRRDIISKLNQAKDPWNVNTLAQIAGEVSLADTDYISQTIAYTNAEKDFLYSELKKIAGLRPYPPAANYIFIDISESGFNSIAIKDKMGQQGILVRDCSSYHNLNEDYIRVAVKSRTDNLKLIKAFIRMKGENNA